MVYVVNRSYTGFIPGLHVAGDTARDAAVEEMIVGVGREYGG